MIRLSLLAMVSGVVLGAVFALMYEAPGWCGAPLNNFVDAYRIPLDLVFAVLVWLPITQRVLRNRIRSLAEAGGLPATVRPARAAWTLAIATLVAVMVHDGVTYGEWLMSPTGFPDVGFPTFLFLASFPLLTWYSVESSLRDEGVET